MNAGEPYIIFELNEAAYGLRSADVLHVEMLEHITPVPNTASAVEGIVFSRGQLYPALNLRVRFGLEPTPVTPQTRLLFVRIHQRTVALIVDAAREFRTLPSDAIRPVEHALHGIDGNYLQGVATVNGRTVILLDLLSVLNLDDPAPLEAAAATAHPFN
jgi:purine-binding chemotaxis protein CheW